MTQVCIKKLTHAISTVVLDFLMQDLYKVLQFIKTSLNCKLRVVILFFYSDFLVSYSVSKNIICIFAQDRNSLSVCHFGLLMRTLCFLKRYILLQN